MRRNQFLAVAIAAFSALVAVLLAKTFIVDTIQGQAGRFSKLMRPQGIETTLIVAALRDLPVGTELTREMLQEIKWPTESVPPGAFKSIDEMYAIAPRRVVLTELRVNEPVVAGKVTPAGQRASLSAMLRPGMKAVAIRVNDVIGVAGFVLPGDRVDVLMIRDTTKTAEHPSDLNIYSDVILQDIRVLAVDQSMDETGARPLPAQTVTVEVGMADAQKLALSASVGNLSLTLREVGTDAPADDVRRVTVADLAVEKTIDSEKSLDGGIVTPSTNQIASDKGSVEGESLADDRVTVTVITATRTQEYRVIPR